MRKVILILSFMFVQFKLCAQIIGSDIVIDDKQCFSKVYNNSNDISKKFSNAKEWIAKTYGDYQSVLQFEDDKNYKIIIKGVQTFEEERAETSHSSGRVFIFTNASLCYTLTIDFKEDRYRLKMEDICVKERVKTNIIMLSSLSTEEFIKTVDDFTSPTTFVNLLEADNKLLSQLQEVDTSTMKKKWMKEEHQRNIRLTEMKIVYDKQQIENMEVRKKNIYNFIANLYNSLSGAIEYNDDF